MSAAASILAKSKTPVATEALRRIAALYKIEDHLRSHSAADRLAGRQVESRPLIMDLRAWLDARIATLPARGPTAEAIRYALNHWDLPCPDLGSPIPGRPEWPDAGDSREEPGAGKPHARICEGESRMAELFDRHPNSWTPPQVASRHRHSGTQMPSGGVHPIKVMPNPMVLWSRGSFLASRPGYATPSCRQAPASSLA